MVVTVVDLGLLGRVMVVVVEAVVAWVMVVVVVVVLRCSCVSGYGCMYVLVVK